MVQILRPIAALTAALIFAVPVSALSVGQIDTFQDGTTQGWHVGGGPNLPEAFPPVIPDGGPNGSGDQFLQVESTGGAGPGSRLSVLNTSQWAGNYVAASITAIAMDVRNFGPEDLSLRLLFVGFDGGMFAEVRAA